MSLPSDIQEGSGLTPTANSPEVSSVGAFGAMPGVSSEFLGYLIAVFTIGGTIALIEDKSPKAAWVLAVVVLLGMIVVSESRAGLIERFASLIRSVSLP